MLTAKAFPSQQSHFHHVASSVEVGNELGAEEVGDAGSSGSNLLSCSVSSGWNEGTSCSRNRESELRQAVQADRQIEGNLRGERFAFLV